MSPRALAQMGRREAEREGGKKGSRRRARERWKSRRLRVRPAPRSGVLAVGGYKRPRGRGSERPHASAYLVLFPARPTFCKRALVLPFIGVRRGSRCTMGGVAECYVSSGGALEPGGRTAVEAVESLLTSSCFRKGAESRRHHRACGAPSLPIWRSEPDGTPVLFPVA
jgi:hypothetical protein